MKFRNPDTNQIFVDIHAAYADFCNARDCDTDCPLDDPTCKDGYPSCSVWAIHHPVEAARLMGYEVGQTRLLVKAQARKDKRKR